MNFVLNEDNQNFLDGAGEICYNNSAMMKRSSRKRHPREDGSSAERPSDAQHDEGRF